MRNWPTRPARLLPSLQVLFVLLLLFVVGQDNWAQPKVQIPRSVNTSDVDNLIIQGKELESRQQWSDAQIHYRDALRQYPDDEDLQALLKTAGIHSDLARRYHDTSFLASLTTISPDKAQDSFSEVLLKIQTHHFEQPRWEAIARQGMQHFQIALSDPLLLKHHQIDPSSVNLKEFLDASDELIRKRQHTRRADLVQTVLLIAQNARDAIQLPVAATLLEFTCGTASGMDKYSCYLTPYQLDEMFSQIEGNFVGIGIELKSSLAQLKVIRVISAGPASEGGIQPGDLVLSVDGQAIPRISPSQAADMLRGPDGSQVRVTIQRDESPPQQITLHRRRVEIPSIEDVKIIDPETGIGYLRITCFQKTTSQDLDDALWQLHRQGMKSLVIDIRNNPGGLLIGSVEVADHFLDQGTIVRTRGRSSHEDVDYKAHELGTWNLPIVVLINGNSASASEIFAGAIHDHQRGHVVGRTTYGKGSVQGIFPLSNTTAGVRLTTARFFSPSGHAISNAGVTPDVLVHVARRPAGNGNPSLTEKLDPILDAGLAVLRESLAKP